MPTIGSFHSQFWRFSDTAVAPSRVGRGGYPVWQMGVIAPSLFGAIGAWWDALYAKVTWWRAFYKRWERLTGAQRGLALRVIEAVETLTDEQRAVTDQVLNVLYSPVYPIAGVAVRGTATTLGFNRPEAWRELSRAIKDDPGRAENVYRHQEAMRRLRAALKAQGSTLTNPQQNLVTELAYTGFAWKGR